MKKITSLAIIILTLALALTSCDIGSIIDGIQGGASPSEKTIGEACDTLNGLLAATHSKITLTTTLTENGIDLTARYVITDELVSYSVHKLNLIPGLGEGEMPSDLKTVINGTATVKDGNITHFDGEAVTLPDYTTLTGGFYFSASNLKNTALEDNVLDADVISASELFGASTDAAAMHVSADFSNTELIKITVEYTAGSASVKTVYEIEA